MEIGEFELQIKTALEEHKKLIIKQNRKPGEEDCDFVVNAFNEILQMVMDEVGSREDWQSKLQIIQNFEGTVRDFYGIAINIPVMTMDTLYKRLLLEEWGADNPHDPFHKHDGKK